MPQTAMLEQQLSDVVKLPHITHTGSLPVAARDGLVQFHVKQRQHQQERRREEHADKCKFRQ
jgi:hypothetical protein